MAAINVDKWNSLTEEQQDIVMQGVEAGRQYCDDTNNAREASLIEFFEEQGLSVYYPDVEAFSTHVTEYYLNNDISSTWDKELLAEIQSMD